MAFLRNEFIRMSLLVLKIPKLQERFSNLKSPCMDLNNLQEHGLRGLPRQCSDMALNKSQSNHTLFIKNSPHGKVKALIVYVDDFFQTGDDLDKMQW